MKIAKFVLSKRLLAEYGEWVSFHNEEPTELGKEGAGAGNTDLPHLTNAFQLVVGTYVT